MLCHTPVKSSFTKFQKELSSLQIFDMPLALMNRRNWEWTDQAMDVPKTYSPNQLRGPKTGLNLVAQESGIKAIPLSWTWQNEGYIHLYANVSNVHVPCTWYVISWLEYQWYAISLSPKKMYEHVKLYEIQRWALGSFFKAALMMRMAWGHSRFNLQKKVPTMVLKYQENW